MSLTENMSVRDTASSLGVWQRFETGVRERLSCRRAARLLARVGSLPVRPSRATRSLGSYVARRRTPLEIRLQFAQEADQLAETLLHELAHVCCHLQGFFGVRTWRGHGPEWQAWATAFNIPPERCGHSPAVAELHARRLKVVAVCNRCGAEIRRVRRLNRGRQYIHPVCGGKIAPV